jgi:hypothetical protein
MFSEQNQLDLSALGATDLFQDLANTLGWLYVQVEGAFDDFTNTFKMFIVGITDNHMFHYFPGPW